MYCQVISQIKIRLTDISFLRSYFSLVLRAYIFFLYKFYKVTNITSNVLLSSSVALGSISLCFAVFEITENFCCLFFLSSGLHSYLLVKIICMQYMIKSNLFCLVMTEPKKYNKLLKTFPYLLPFSLSSYVLP